MLTKTRKFTLGFLMAVMALSASIVWADSGDVKPVGSVDSSHKSGDWHHGKEGHLPSIAKILNLSDDQEKQLKDSRQKQKEAMKSIFEQLKSNREAFDTEIVKAALDMNKINDIQAQLKTIQSQMVDNHLNAILGIKKILTSEQFDGYMALKKERELMEHGKHHPWDHKGEFERNKDGQVHSADKGNKGDEDSGAYLSEDEE